MPVLLVRHRATDYAVWKAVFDEHAATLRAYGSRGGRVFRSDADPSEIWTLLEWDDLDRARLFAQSDDLHEVMVSAGLADNPKFWFLEETDRPSP